MAETTVPLTVPLTVVIVEKTGELKQLSMKDFKVEELYKKCGFKKADDFTKQGEWTIPLEDVLWHIEVMAKAVGRANSENKYEFPPPMDNVLLFGNAVIVAKCDGQYANLDVATWKKIYNHLYGGFENLADTAKEDEEEEDELANVPKHKKTKDGYLKDGFVVDGKDIDYRDGLESELSEESYDYDSDDSSDYTDRKEK
jgi:hypothetical protein